MWSIIHWHTAIYLVYVIDEYNVRTGILMYEYTITVYLYTSTHPRQYLLVTYYCNVHVEIIIFLIFI